MKLGEKIKHLRVKKGMTQEDLASAIGSTKASISNYERNVRIPQYSILFTIADVLDVPMSELITYMPTDESDIEKVVVKNQTDNKRPVRFKRLMEAFNKLSDEAQIKAIERVEEFTLIPMYQMSLPEALQRYIYNEYQLSYELSTDTTSQESYELDNGLELLADVRNIVLKRKRGKDQSKWHFSYYHMSDDVNDSIVEPIVCQYERVENFQDKYSFVLDDMNIYERFCECHEDHRNLVFEDQNNMLVPMSPEITFFLIDKDTREIKEVRSSKSYGLEPDWSV